MDKPIFTYLEIKSYQDGKVVKRIDITGKSETNVAKIDNGININLNHAEFYTFIFDSETKLGEV